jgi:hypothetical protein
VLLAYSEVTQFSILLLMPKDHLSHHLASDEAKKITYGLLPQADLKSLLMVSKPIALLTKNMFGLANFAAIKKFALHKTICGQIAAPIKSSSVLFPTAAELNQIEEAEEKYDKKISVRIKLEKLIKILHEPLKYYLQDMVADIEYADPPGEIKSPIADLILNKNIFRLFDDEISFLFNILRQYKIACDCYRTYKATGNLIGVKIILQNEKYFCFAPALAILELIVHAAVEKREQNMIILLLDCGVKDLANRCLIAVMEEIFDKNFILQQLVSHCVNTYFNKESGYKWNDAIIKNLAKYPGFLPNLYKEIVIKLKTLSVDNQIILLEALVKNNPPSVIASLFHANAGLLTFYKKAGRVFLEEFGTMLIFLRNPLLIKQAQMPGCIIQ